MQVKSPMTMTEKILAKHADRQRVAPGENIWTRVDKLLTHDVCGPGTFGIFQKEFGENAQVWHAQICNYPMSVTGFLQMTSMNSEASQHQECHQGRKARQH